MRVVLTALIYRRETDPKKGEKFWVMFINGEPAYKERDRGELIRLLELTEE